MDEEYYKILVITVTAFLIISLAINFLLASDPHAFSSPPLRISGYPAVAGKPGLESDVALNRTSLPDKKQSLLIVRLPK